MPLTKAQGLFLSNDELLGHLLENAANRIQLAEKLPFFPVNGDTLRIERSQVSDFGVDPLFDTVPVTVTEGVAVPTSGLEAKFELKLLVQDVIVEDLVAINQSNVNSQVGVQLEAATRRMLYKFWKTFGMGDTSVNSQEFSGVRKLCPAGQTITPLTDTTNFMLDLNDLSRLVSKVTANNGRPHALWTNGIGYKNILFAHFAKGLLPDYITDTVPDSNGGYVQRRRLAFEGVPVYIDDTYNPTGNETIGTFSNGQSIYAMVLGRGGLYGIVPASVGKKMIRVKEVLAATTTNATYRVFWPVGLALEKEDALARLQFRAQASTL